MTPHDDAAHRLILVESSTGDDAMDLALTGSKAAWMAQKAGITGERIVESYERDEAPITTAGERPATTRVVPFGTVTVTFAWH